MKGSVHAREEIHPAPFSALFYDTNWNRPPLSSTRHLFMPLREIVLVRPSSMYLLALFLSLTFTTVSSSSGRGSHIKIARFFFPLTMCHPYSTLGKIIGLALWHLTTRYNVCAIMERNRCNMSSEENSSARDTTFHFRHITSTTSSRVSLLTLIKLSTFYF